MESILISVKKLLGIDKDYDAFDMDIIIHINTVFMILNQLGIGPDGFAITGYSERWNDFTCGDKMLEAVKSYMYLKVATMFDPPTVGAVAESKNRAISELEWRLNVLVDNQKGGES